MAMRWNARAGLVCACWPAILAAACPASADSAAPETVVVTASALPGTALDPDRIPAAIQTLTADDLSRFGAASMLGALDRSATGVSLSDAQENPFQPNLVYRGFEASPLAGDAQGLAVYVDGVRFNQPFGDVVGWDLIPDIAIDRLTVEGSNPVFGLNALGGSISVRMKDGFGWDGTEIEGLGGSFGRWQGSFQFGRQDGGLSLYIAGSALHETGWRDHSPSRLGQIFADFGWRQGRGELHLDLTAADTRLNGNGPAPVQLLAIDRAAVFTYPDETRNTYGLANLFGAFQANDALSLQGNLYVSRLRARSENGDASDAEPCDDGSGFLCLEDGAIVTGTDGDPIPDFLAGGVYAQLNTTSTSTTGFGGALQALYLGTVFGRDNRLLAGLTYDAGRTAFWARSELGALTKARGFAGPGIVIDQADGEIAPVGLDSRNDYAGLYLAESASVTQHLSLTFSARYNFSRIALRDELGGGLNGMHGYSRINPAAGLTYAFSPAAGLYAGYSEANRAPTPAEFSCADPGAPCSLTNFFVDDPPLKQVVADTLEAGLRGQYHGLADVAWHAGAFRADAADDILFAASPILGRGYFRNIGTTRRQGIELSATVERGPWRASLDYTYTDATFRTALTLNSPDNPHADARGEIFVVPGDRLPGIPANMLKLSATYRPGPNWTLGVASRFADGQYLRGDESNLNAKTHPYAVLDASAAYRLNDRIELFGEIDNLFDAKYETFGGFAPTSDVPIVEAPGATNPRSLSPAAPFTLHAGVRVSL